MRFLPTLAVAAALLLGALGAPAFAATITPQTRLPTDTNVVVTFAAATGGGDVVTNTAGGVVILVANRDVSTSLTLTVVSQATNIPPGTAKTNLSITVPAGKTALVGPLDKAVWNDVNGAVDLTYSAVTNVFVGAYTH